MIKLYNFFLAIDKLHHSAEVFLLGPFTPLHKRIIDSRYFMVLMLFCICFHVCSTT